jgi:hypothetical protein
VDLEDKVEMVLETMQAQFLEATVGLAVVALLVVVVDKVASVSKMEQEMVKAALVALEEMVFTLLAVEAQDHTAILAEMLELADKVALVEIQ